MIIKASQSIVLLLATFSLALAAELPALEKDLIGPVSASTLLTLDAFSNQYAVAPISSREVNALASIDSDISLRLLFGSWCHDSVREVPRLIKLIELAGNSKLSLQLTAVSRDKLEPSAVVERFALKFTPTLVVLKDNEEIGRIIEQPNINWAADIVALVQQH